MNRVQYNYWLL